MSILARVSVLAVHLLGACYQRPDTPNATSRADDESSSDGSSSDDGVDPGTSDDSTAEPEPQPDPYCGDASCDASEDCSSCPTDCNACPSVCGDGLCAGDEDWSACWKDCNEAAPARPFTEIYGACAGMNEIAGVPAGDHLFVRNDTGSLVYVSHDAITELSDITLVGEEVRQRGEVIGTLECHADPQRGCVPIVVVSVYPDTGGEMVPCLFPHDETLALSLEGTTLGWTNDAYFEPCATLCGNGSCDPYEIDCGTNNLQHACFDDCGTPEGCSACA